MAIINDAHRPDTQELASITLESIGERVEEATRCSDIDQAVDIIYPREAVKAETLDTLQNYKFSEKANGRRWAVMIFDGSDPKAIIPKRIELERFCKFFGTHPVQHYNDYAPYDDSSYFVTVIDAENPDAPKPAAALRIVHDGPAGLKTINTLASENPQVNPWAEELADYIHGFTPAEAARNIEHAMHADPVTTWGIETMAALDGYAGHKGSLGEASFPLYAACLQLSDLAGIKTWISIQDLKPMQQMQELFAEPWDTLPVQPKAFEGPYPTLPAYIADMEKAESNLRSHAPDMAGLLIEGTGLEITYLMPNELQGIDYLNSLV